MNNVIILTVSGIRRLFSNKKYLALLLVLVLVSLYTISIETEDYKARVTEGKEFQELEAAIFSKISNYDRYSDIGVQVFFTPSPLSIFNYVSPASAGLYAKVNSIADLKISNNAKSPKQLSEDFPFQLRFCFIVLFILSLFAMYIGCGATRYREFTKSEVSAWSSGKIYLIELLSRYIFLILIYLTTLGISIIHVIYKGIDLTYIDTKGIYRNIAVTFLMLLFFYFIGTIIPLLLRSKVTINSVVLVVWIAFVFFIPLIIKSINDQKTLDFPSAFKLDSQKYNTLSEFEVNAEKKYGQFSENKIDTGRRVIEGYWNNESIQILNLEKRLRDLFLKQIEKKERIAALTPVTFYLNNFSEASSCGDRSFIAFYDYLIDLQRQFLRFWIDRVYYNDPKVMVNFIKGDENIFKSKSRVPGNFNTGVFILIGYVVASAVFSYLAFLKSISGIKSKDLAQIGEVELEEMKNGELKVWITKSDNLIKVLFNLFSGNFKRLRAKGFSGKVVVNGVDIAAAKSRENFIYICRPEFVPGDTRVKDFYHFYTRALKIDASQKKEALKSSIIKPLLKKTFAELTKPQKFYVTLSILQFKKKQVYLVDDICDGLDELYALKLKEKLDELKDVGALVIYVNTSIAIAEELDEKIYEGDAWLYTVNGAMNRKKFFKHHKKHEEDIS